MQGFITDADLGEADEVFPGIAKFFDSLTEKPRTFLELVSQFDHWTEHPVSTVTAPGVVH